jgi:MoaA/NifB/PqqE/SkfB family radical SAM enzyme
MARRVLPRHIQIDASAHCQLACKSCPTADGDVARALGAGHLDPQKFAALLDRNPGLCEVELSNYGEMFLNPRLAEILRIAWERKVTLHADNGVNLNFAPDETLEALVKYGFRSMTCSIDGASAESYPQYRVKGDFDRVIGHIRKINEYKRRYRSGFPFLRWQFIVFGHNEHEIAAARKLAAELDMQFVPKLSWDDDVSPIRNRELVQIETRSRAVSRAEYYQATGRDYMRHICAQLWHAPVLNWDGRVTGCCRNFWGGFGANAFTDGLEEAINAPAIVHAREMLMGRAAERPDLPCTTCDLYQTMKRDRSWIAAEETAAAPAILCSIVVERGESAATHVDIFLAPGEEVNRTLLVRPPKATRLELGRTWATQVSAAAAGPYTIYALPRRLDPTFRAQYPAMEAVTRPVQVAERPVAQEFRIAL